MKTNLYRQAQIKEVEFIKECIMSVIREVCPEKKGAFKNISYLARTVTWQTEELSKDVNPF